MQPNHQLFPQLLLLARVALAGDCRVNKHHDAGPHHCGGDGDQNGHELQREYSRHNHADAELRHAGDGAVELRAAQGAYRLQVADFQIVGGGENLRRESARAHARTCRSQRKQTTHDDHSKNQKAAKQGAHSAEKQHDALVPAKEKSFVTMLQ